MVEAADLGGCVKFYGAMNNSEMLKKIAESDYLLAPSITASNGDQEAIPNFIKEAMAVTASDHSGAPEVVRHGMTGFFV